MTLKTIEEDGFSGGDDWNGIDPLLHVDVLGLDIVQTGGVNVPAGLARPVGKTPAHAF